MGNPGRFYQAHRCAATRAVLFLLTFFLTLPAVAQHNAANPPSDWRKAATAEGLPVRDINQLEVSKVLIGGREFKQSFEPYTEGTKLPFFITSDSLLNGFHVLFEETLRRHEQANAARLPGLLSRMWECLWSDQAVLQGPPELLVAARKRARIVLGVGLRLNGLATGGVTADESAVIEVEKKRVEAASETAMPSFLGPPRADLLALDYGRFRPRGFYASSPEMRTYFQTVAWLQAIPFRLDSDEELLAFILLSSPLSLHEQDYSCSQWQSEFEGFLQSFKSILGDPYAIDLSYLLGRSQTSMTVGGDSEELASWREDLKEYLVRSPGSDQDQIKTSPMVNPASQSSTLRIFPSFRTPEGGLFQRTTDPLAFPNRPLPSGLEVATLLGAKEARNLLLGADRDALLKTIDAQRKATRADGSFYQEYLNALQALVAAPEPGAPPFMGQTSWRRKNLNTLLGGWAQLRHAFVLQTQETVVYAGIVENPAGFVEPVPEFYARMARMVRRLQWVFKKSGALEIDWRLGVPQARETLASIDQTEKIFLEDDRSIGPWMYGLMGALLPRQPWKNDVDWRLVRSRLQATIANLEQGKAPDDPRVREFFTGHLTGLQGLWNEYEVLCLRLEALAHKQLRGLAWTTEEEDFIRSYGEFLAGTMLYGGNAYLEPKDDAPRIVDVAVNPMMGRVLQVGVGRPRALYVLFPWKGQEILCRGAVMPYYEFATPSRLTDSEWKDLLATPQRPKPPEWVQLITGVTVPPKPQRE